MANRLRETFWVLALGVIACFAFFFMLGAIDPAQVVAVTAVVLGLVVLWIAHAWLEHRHAVLEDRDPRLSHARERRGF
jgi:membrane protein implicated in regulation of membrane protease activity